MSSRGDRAQDALAQQHRVLLQLRGQMRGLELFWVGTSMAPGRLLRVHQTEMGSGGPQGSHPCGHRAGFALPQTRVGAGYGWWVDLLGSRASKSVLWGRNRDVPEDFFSSQDTCQEEFQVTWGGKGVTLGLLICI